jgi:sulfhydrogenase subunit alpha
MSHDTRIDVHHLTRVEGHGDIAVEIKDGRLEKIRFAVVEAPRFFEAFLRGQNYTEVTHLASRICGICAVSHKSAALKATEAALGVETTEQTRLLRLLAYHGEIISSHILHIYFLAGPDFFGVSSIFPLVKSNREMVLRAMRLKRLGYDLSALVGGRHTHPVAMTVGGFSFVHRSGDLADMKKRVEHGLEDITGLIQDFKAVNFPAFERETQYVSLTHPERYAFYEGDVYSSTGETVAPTRYREIINEYVVPYSTAKYARWHLREYMVGALARVNNNSGQLLAPAREVADELGLKVPCFNPFMITVAQIVECVHCLHDSIELLETLVQSGIRAELSQVEVPVQDGKGIGAVEAPRGLLFHEYEYDREGKCLAANHVIPTAQNLANIEADMRAFVPAILSDSKESMTLQLEMLIRAYDPCISCSTHILEL